MPAIIGMLWGGLALILQSTVGRVLIALGISYLSYQGIDALITNMTERAFAAMGQSVGALEGVVGMLRLGESISVVMSALTAKYVLAGMQSGAISRMIIK